MQLSSAEMRKGEKASSWNFPKVCTLLEEARLVRKDRRVSCQLGKSLLIFAITLTSNNDGDKEKTYGFN